ncbi:uncharacterized protein EV420DRAFT_1274085 [Desarmillaria tabescens]|uniref:Uncharacterized protein n=1 Tax=Armillaria tabescens TaxID=1929756 RepID=A0AA39K351_ARMTA|nr:uncharacterized protein EV420DRAFT_1274085 [Desarmillaria tabescens]KAK0451363.1 hypothetical protein EV420DRAFT_1274085 [Desarmillaria tabescens]
MVTDRAPDIYVPLMLPKGHGYPLWLPDPLSNLPPAYLSRGTQIGDLGYLADDGGFVYLFNVCKDADDPVNLNRVPPGFVPLTSNSNLGVLERLEMHDKNSTITTSAVEQKSIEFDVSAEAPTALGAGCGFEFTSSSEQGAVLVLPDGGERYDCASLDMFEEYAIANAHSWYKYLNGQGQGRQIRNGMLYLVTGCDKCYSWGNACYSHLTQSRCASLKFLTTGVAELSGTLRYRWEVQSGVHKRSHHRDMTPGAIANQTVFLRGYSISVRESSALRLLLGVKTVKVSKSDMTNCKQLRAESRVPYATEQRNVVLATTGMSTSGTTQVIPLAPFYKVV